jgi:peptidoglycan/LPS O-acetylase OafA/YrhL
MTVTAASPSLDPAVAPSADVPQPAAYLPVLDGFRAIAIADVLAGHFTHFRFIPGGFGVTLFFFISGLLITRLLLAELDGSERIDLRRFYARRIVRLAPALLTMIAIVTATAVIRGKPAPPGDVIAAVFYFANYYRVFVGFTLTFGLLWSLAVEEHYYLIFPTLLGRINRSRSPLGVLIALVGAALVWRLVLVLLIHPPVDYTYMATDTRFDSILYGAILALMISRNPAVLKSRWLVSVPAFLAGVAALLATFMFKGVFLRETIRYSIQGVALLPIVAALTFGGGQALFRSIGRVLAWPPLVLLGKLSYSLYLWHYPCIFAVAALAPRLSAGVSHAIAFGVSFAVSALSYYGVERSFLTLRRRFGSHAR